MVSLNQVPVAVLTIIIIGAFVGIGAVFVAQLNETVTTISGQDSVAQDAVETTLTAVGDIADWLPVIVIVIIMAVIITLFAFLRMNQQRAG